MIEIRLAGDFTAYIDNEDFGRVSRYPWWVHRNSGLLYARTQLQPSLKPLCMHVLLLGRRPGFVIDHKDGDGLNNQRDNLRWATNAQNLQNRGPHKHGVSKFKGVFRPSARTKWRAEITANSKKVYLGSFDTEIEAALAYNEAAARLHGEFARLNPIPS